MFYSQEQIKVQFYSLHMNVQLTYILYQSNLNTQIYFVIDIYLKQEQETVLHIPAIYLYL